MSLNREASTRLVITTNSTNIIRLNHEFSTLCLSVRYWLSKFSIQCLNAGFCESSLVSLLLVPKKNLYCLTIMPKSAAPNSLGQIAWFAVLSLIYSYMNYKLLVSGDDAATATMRTTYFSIYLLLSVIGQYFITLGVSAGLCGSPQYYTSTVAVLFPWGFIFGVMDHDARAVPLMVSPFL